MSFLRPYALRCVVIIFIGIFLLASICENYIRTEYCSFSKLDAGPFDGVSWLRNGHARLTGQSIRDEVDLFL